MIELCILIWMVSIMLSVCVMMKKDIPLCSWSFFLVLFPVVNTYIAIRYFRVDIRGFKEVWKLLNASEKLKGEEL